MVHQIIYTSAALPSATQDEFRSIARQSSINNKTLDVTGIMLYFQGNIMQVLEGDKDTVVTLFERIKSDKRHTSITKLLSRDANSREFSDWSMGFSDAGSENSIELSFLLNKANLKHALPEAPSPELDILTKTYARISGL